MSGFLKLFALLVGMGLASAAAADAIMRTEAMNASTIAEYYIEQGEIRVELEIGLQDLQNFRNLMPDDIYQKLGHPPRPLVERLEDFFRKDLVIATPAGPLIGQLREIGPRVRIRRDLITGEQLPVSEDDEETVIAALLVYALDGEPQELILSAPRTPTTANIGFVVYHHSVAINDFRYLSQSLLLNLDWQDPWYSAFAQRTMRRSYYLPMSGFLYIEPFEVRKEIIVRPKDMQRWVDLGLADAELIKAEQRGTILEKISTFLTPRQPVTIDGQAATPILDRANFLNRSLKSSLVVEPGVDINLDSAVVGVIFVYPTSELPNKATMKWDMFDERTREVTASAVDEAGPFPTTLEPGYALLEWENFLRNPTIPGLVELPPPPSLLARWAYQLRWWAVAIALISLTLWALRRSTLVAAVAVFAMLTLGLSLVLGRPLAPPTKATEKVVIDLLRNVYQAFDYREESAIYDTLERSVSGDLLTDIYLETRRGLELSNQGGARAKVKSVELQAIEIQAGRGGNGFQALATWNVNGSVGHWGHVHTRSNQYRAELFIEAIDNRWKLTQMNVLEEQRL